MTAEVDLQPGESQVRSVLVVVAHPDDETLWSGGLILSHPHWYCTIVALCRASDPDRAPKFRNVCARLRATSSHIADLDDGPEQLPLASTEIESTLLALVPSEHWDCVLTHSPRGEYTRHRRHEEVAEAVAGLWTRGRISADELWMFAYEDADRSKFPEALETADLRFALSEEQFLEKYEIITRLYGFDVESWEARATPRIEGFWRFDEPTQILKRFGKHPAAERKGDESDESACPL